MRSLDMAPRFGCEVAMTIDAVNRGATVVEHDVDMDHHHTGRTWRRLPSSSAPGCGRNARTVSTSRARRCATRRIVILTMFILGFIMSGSTKIEAAKGDALPHAEPVQVILVPGWTWDDITRDGNTIVNFKGLENILDPHQPMTVGSIATGNVKDIARAVAQGSRDDTKNEPNDIRVSVRPKGITRSENFPPGRESLPA